MDSHASGEEFKTKLILLQRTFQPLPRFGGWKTSSPRHDHITPALPCCKEVRTV